MGNLLSSPVTKKETHTGATPCGIEYGVSSMQGWRVHMEDSHICEPHLYAQAPQRSEEPAVKFDLEGHSLFAVFDGHGGTFAAVYAGANLCRVLSRQSKFVAYAEFVKERPEKEPTLEGTAERIKYIQSGLGLLEGALRDAFVDIDREIYLASIGRPVPEANQPYHENGPDPVTADPQPANEDSGSTAIAVVVTPQWIVCANSGDSRSVLSRQGNKACPLSYDHKPDDYDEEKRVKAAGGYVAEGRVGGDLAVSRGLGDYRFKDAETVMLGNDFDATAPSSDSQRQMLAPEQMQVTACPDIIIRNRNPETDEFIVVACDGIWDVQSNQQFVNVVADILQEGESNIGLVCEETLDFCLRMGSKDNMTTLLVKFPAQKIGEGDGVEGRRVKRGETNAEPATTEDNDEEKYT